MSFRAAPRIAAVSSDVAKHAKSYSGPASEADRQHAAAVARAEANRGSEAEADVQKILNGNIKAKYKIEVFFGPDRTLRGPNLTQVQFFESGNKMHGGGDQLMWLCKNPEDERLGCGAFIPGDAIRDGIAMCPGCRQMVKASALTERLIARPTTRTLAKSLAIWFRKLGSNADIYCKYDQEDIRYISMVKRLGAKRAHKLRGLHLYPLRNILRDTSNGATVEDRIFAFLTA